MPTTMIAEQVFVGKMPSNRSSGQLSLFAPPAGFGWLKHFSADELAEFLSELLAAVTRSEQSDNWSDVAAVLESWKSTANILADDAVYRGVEQGMAELHDGQGVSWMDLKQELDL